MNKKTSQHKARPRSAEPLRRMLAHLSGAGLLVGAGLLAAGAIADIIILDPLPRIEGSVALNGETFGSGRVSTAAGTVNFGSDGRFSAQVPADSVWFANFYLYSFPDTSATVRLSLYNQPALAHGDVQSLELTADSGRISGVVAVTGGSVEVVRMQTIAADSSLPAQYLGSVQVAAPPFTAVQPTVALPDTRVYGSVQVQTEAGCTASFPLSDRYVDVTAGSDITVEWTIDASAYVCPAKSTLEGAVTLEGLDAPNSDAIPASGIVRALGPTTKSDTINLNDMSYYLPELEAGNYLLLTQFNFSPPYRYLRTEYASSIIELGAGDTLVENRSYALGTAHTVLDLQGAWNLSRLNNGYVYFNGIDGSNGYDLIDRNSGSVDLVMRAGSNSLNRIALNPSVSGAGYSSSMSLNTYLYGDGAIPIDISVNERATVDDIVLETSVTDVVFQVAQDEGQPPNEISRLSISGYSEKRDTDGALLGRNYIGANYYPFTGTSSLAVEIPGFPGEYELQAVGYGTDGRQYRAPFEIILGAPNDTPAGTDVSVPIVDENGQSVGSVTFDSVSEGGDTTISQTSLGPDRPGFQVSGSGSAQYFDISTTATFSGFVTVCFNYDDSNMQHETLLQLGHYIEASSPPVWEDITTSLDTVNNEICGETDSFSLFAIFEPIILDSDSDGVIDEEDNCPATANPGQGDFDGDGIGDACDFDSDGDGLTDAEDLCPNFYATDNNDLDGDLIGDPCDFDVDGDSVANVSDNCPLIANTNQADFDGDLLGDDCDTDDDGDQFADSNDTCAGTQLGAKTDNQGCSSPQRFELLCPSDGIYRNHGRFVSCVAREADRQVTLGLLTVRQKGAIVSNAASSDIGKQ